MASCLHEASETCGSGGVCPAGLHCADTGAAQICILGTCGNGTLDPGEYCDDGNNKSGDGCPADCGNPCGDGVLDPGEACDDGNHTDGDGCSADCKSLDGMFMVSPPTVSFAATEGDPLPQAIEVSANLELAGDFVRVGYASGIQQPTWLAITSGPSTAKTTAFEFQVTDTSLVGTRATTVRFMLSHERTTGQVMFDLPVSYTVAPSDLGVAAAPGALSFTSAAGDTRVPPQTVNVTFNGERATLLAAPSWLTIAPPADPASSPAAFTITVNDLSPQAGSSRSGELVFATTNAAGTFTRTATVQVTDSVTAPPALAISAAPNPLTFAAAPSGRLPLSQQTDVTFNGSEPTVVSAPPWLTVSAPPPPMTSPAPFTVSVNTTQLAAGSLSDRIVFGTTRSGVQQTATVNVTYTLAPQPDVQFIAPYLGVAGRGGTVRIRGQLFPTAAPVTVAFGDVTANPVIADSDTQLTVSYPPLSVGRYPVTLQPAGTATSEAELVIVAPPAFTYQAIDAPTTRTRILYDAERQMIYGIDPFDQELEIYVFAGGTWSSLPPQVIPNLTDEAMIPGGRSLLLVDSSNINEMSLTDGRFLLVQRFARPDLFCDESFDLIAAANDGEFIIVTDSPQCPGLSDAFVYDIRNNSLSGGTESAGSALGGSGDGSRIYDGVPTFGAVMFDSLSSTFSNPNVDIDPTAISVSDDGSRVILSNTEVCSPDLIPTGNLPSTGIALASHDANRAFVYVEDTTSAHLDIYDLTGALQADGSYPLLGTVILPDRANATGTVSATTMASSLDDSTVFISGNSKLLVVPVS